MQRDCIKMISKRVPTMVRKTTVGVEKWKQYETGIEARISCKASQLSLNWPVQFYRGIKDSTIIWPVNEANFFLPRLVCAETVRYSRPVKLISFRCHLEREHFFFIIWSVRENKPRYRYKTELIARYIYRASIMWCRCTLNFKCTCVSVSFMEYYEILNFVSDQTWSLIEIIYFVIQFQRAPFRPTCKIGK